MENRLEKYGHRVKSQQPELVRGPSRAIAVEQMGRGYAWLDTGTHESLLVAHQFFQAIEHRQGLKIAYPEGIAFRQKWTDADQMERLAQPRLKNGYGQ